MNFDKFKKQTKAKILGKDVLVTRSNVELTGIQRELYGVVHSSIDNLLNFHDGVFSDREEFADEIRTLEQIQSRLAEVFYNKAKNAKSINSGFDLVTKTADWWLTQFMAVFPPQPKVTKKQTKKQIEMIEQWYNGVNEDLPKIIISFLWVFVRQPKYSLEILHPILAGLKPTIERLVKKLNINPNDWTEIK